MRLLVIDKEAKVRNGVEVFNQRFLSVLEKKNHKIYRLRWSNRKIEANEKLSHIPYYVGIEKFYTVLAPSIKSIKIFNQTLAKVKPDLIHLTIGNSLLDPLFIFLSHRKKIPIAGTLHVVAGKNKGIYDIPIKIGLILAFIPFLKKHDLLHVLSPDMKDFFVKYGIAEKKVTVIPNGVNSKLYSPGKSNFARKNGIRKGILFFGRLSWQKNPELLIKSFLKLDAPSDTKLVMAGMGELYEKLSKKYQDERIIFTGLIDSEKERIDIIRSCQIFVLASRTEGHSLSLLEAMSSGLVPIVSDVGSNKDTVSDTGTVIKLSHLKSELPIALKKYLEDCELTKNLGIKARERVMKNYVEKENFQRLLNAFEQTAKLYKKI